DLAALALEALHPLLDVHVGIEERRVDSRLDALLGGRSGALGGAGTRAGEQARQQPREAVGREPKAYSDHGVLGASTDDPRTGRWSRCVDPGGSRTGRRYRGAAAQDAHRALTREPAPGHRGSRAPRAPRTQRRSTAPVRTTRSRRTVPPSPAAWRAARRARGCRTPRPRSRAGPVGRRARTGRRRT